MKRDFADFWNLMWELALGVCAAFALIERLRPARRTCRGSRWT